MMKIILLVIILTTLAFVLLNLSMSASSSLFCEGSNATISVMTGGC